MGLSAAGAQDDGLPEKRTQLMKPTHQACKERAEDTRHSSQRHRGSGNDHEGVGSMAVSIGLDATNAGIRAELNSSGCAVPSPRVQALMQRGGVPVNLGERVRAPTRRQANGR